MTSYEKERDIYDMMQKVFFMEGPNTHDSYAVIPAEDYNKMISIVNEYHHLREDLIEQLEIFADPTQVELIKKDMDGKTRIVSEMIPNKKHHLYYVLSMNPSDALNKVGDILREYRICDIKTDKWLLWDEK